MGTKFNGTEAEISALNVFIKLNRAAESVSNRVNQFILSQNLTVSQFGVLETLYHLGPMPQCDIGKKLLKTGGNMTMVIDNLEKRKLVERIRSDSDRRFVQVHLTNEGKLLIEKIFPKHVAFIVKEFCILEPDEQNELSRLLKKLGMQDAEPISQ